MENTQQQESIGFNLKEFLAKSKFIQYGVPRMNQKVIFFHNKILTANSLEQARVAK
jgi:hypothetical protein